MSSYAEGKPSSCIGCPYYESRPMVEGDGYENSELIVIGQSPGPDEAKYGKPFIGPSGRVLDRALQQADISRRHSYVTNVVKCFVPPGEKVDPAAVRKCQPLWEAELRQLPKARTVLAVGAEAFNALSGKEIKFVHNRKVHEKSPLTWLRGCPFPLGDRVLLGTLHPAFVMRSGFLNAPTFEYDVTRAGLFARGQLRISNDDYLGSPTTREVEEYVERILAAGEGAVDIETPEIDVDEDEADAIVEIPITTIGLSAAPGESIGVSPDQFGLLDPLFNLQDRAKGLPPVIWVYNGGFDLQHLGKRWRLDGIRPADAMIAFYLLWSDLMSFDLATAESYYCTMGYYKNWRKLDKDRYDTIGNCRDTYGALQIGRACLEEMSKKPIDMRPLFWSLMPVIKAMEPWKTQGCNYDTQSALKLYYELTAILEAYEGWWKENIPRWDWSSSKQLIEMFEAIGTHVPRKKRKKKDGTVYYSPSVDEDFLEGRIEKGDETAKLILTMRTLRHSGQFCTLGNKNSRVTTRGKLHGQAGGRIQLVDEALQTVPEELAGTYPRNLFIPDHPDDLILVSDYGQAEFGIYGWYAQDKTLLDLYLSGEYVYGFFHEEIHHEPFFEAGKPRQKRYILKDIAPWKLLVTKSYPLGITYGRLALPSEYKWLLKWYHSRFTRIDPFHRDLLFRVSNQGFAQTVFGRMRRFPNANGQRSQILAFPGQSTLPDVLVRGAILPLRQSLPTLFGERSRVLFTVHDSVVCNIQGAARSIKVAYDAMDHVTETMQQPIPEMGGFHLWAEAKIGLSWGKNWARHKLENAWKEIDAGLVTQG